MRRWLFGIASAISLLLCIASVGMWVRSYEVVESVALTRVPVQGVLDLEAYSLALCSWHGQLLCIDEPSNRVSRGRYRRVTWSQWRQARGFEKLPPDVMPLLYERFIDRARPRWFAGQPLVDRWGFYLQTNPEAPFLGRNPFSGALWLTAAALPYWALALLAAVAPALQLRGVARRFYRRRHGLCLRCGYDLRASVDRCPECGAEMVSTNDVSAKSMTSTNAAKDTKELAV